MSAVLPAGALTGKIVYTSAGHGWQWSDTLNRWATDRGDNNEIVEDFGNQDQLTFYADYLLRAGATIVPMRPVGRQTNEVVLDNDSPGVTFSGAWTNSTGSVHYDEDYGAVADVVTYRFASISATETATATYTPNIPQAGFYPVYVWAADGSNRTNQLYRITDSDGGVTEIRVDHRMVGKGWVYLGAYHFDAGMGGNVQISNQSTAGGSVVIADAIRFGNGMGDVKDGPAGVGAASGTISGYPREDENSLMWLWRAVGQGNSAAAIIGTSNVSAPSRMAEHMNANANPFGTSVYIGFHSNAGGGRGAVGLIDADASDRTPHQADLALYTGRQINQDMQALNGLFEHTWSTRTTHTFTGQFGEIDEGASAEMDMTIIEVAFHDSVEDAQLMRDPKVRDQLARSTYEATLEYFDNWGGLTSPASQPSKPLNVRAEAGVNGDVTVHWTAGPTGVSGGTPTSFRVFLSHNGYGFYDYVDAAGGGATSVVIPADQLDGGAVYFRVTALNSGGASPASNLAGARPDSADGANRILIVDGFDRYERRQNVRYPYQFASNPSDGLTDRVRSRYNNSFDYVIQVGEAIEAYAAVALGFDSATNDAVISGAVDLADYDAVIWYLGEESTDDDTFNGAEQTIVTNYLNSSGQLFVSGAEIGWDLVDRGGGAAFYNNQLKADYVSDDANSYNVTGAAGSIFAGLAFAFDNGAQFYNAEFPDVIAPIGGSSAALTYSTGGTAGVQFTNAGTGAQVVTFGFPFETITTAANRAVVMDRVLYYFGFVPVVEPTGDFDDDGVVDGADFLAWQRGLGTTGNATRAQGDANLDGNVDAADLDVWADQYGTAPAVAAAALAPTIAPLSELAALAQARALTSTSPPLRGAARRGTPGASSPANLRRVAAAVASSFAVSPVERQQESAATLRSGLRNKDHSAPDSDAALHDQCLEDFLRGERVAR